MIKSTLSNIIIAVLLTFSVNLYSQELPSSSPAATVKQRVGLTDIEITYFRPGVKDRVIFGDLVPYNEMWRTGANKASVISFTTDVEIMGNKLAKGTYAIFTIPGESEWEIIFNKNTEQWGTNGHKPEEDVLRVKVKSESATQTESMMFYFDDIRDESATINLQWATTNVSIPFTVKAGEEAIANIIKAIAETKNAFRVYHNSARYYLDNNLDATTALEWASKSATMQKTYWNMTTLSRAQAANKMYKEAVKTAEEAKTLAIAEKSDFYVKQNTENITAWKTMK